jgi:hypothetical protein|tara:strand:- start:1173 stop:1319 length:147 start_codon:yes stop_codon:yes gene_type:complete
MIQKLVNMVLKCLKVALLPVAWVLSRVSGGLKFIENKLNAIIDKDIGK